MALAVPVRGTASPADDGGRRSLDVGSGSGLRENLIGNAPSFRRALDLIHKIAACDATVLIEGETGTGKELAARAIHYFGKRRDSPFVPVNCGAIPESLIESEFFGHARGAFTDAKEAREGLVAQARGGTLFLDELEVLSARGQVILLRFLQDHVYRPVGDMSTRNGDVRVIGSSNTHLATLAARGQYRSDLAFRLRVLSLELPPLRARPGDAGLLAESFSRRFCAQYGRPPRPLSEVARRSLEGYSWPGNVRELENMIHREVLLIDGPEITLGELDAAVGVPASENRDAVPRFGVAKARAIREFERAYLSDLLRRTQGNISLAARLAGKDRSRLGKLVKKHGLERGASDARRHELPLPRDVSVTP
jgi:DNA-binding NtrC family response regulator